MRRALLLLLSISLALGGCFASTGTPDEGAPATNGSVTIDENRPEPVFNDIPAADLGTLAAPDLEATLAEAPKLREGEWWRIELTDKLTGDVTQFVRVVARVESDLVVMGMPHEGWWKEAVIFHAPAFGDVNLDLSHRAHDVPFQPLQFPLEEGASWETAWENPAPVTATVKLESSSLARVTFEGTSCGTLGIVGLCPAPSQGKVAEVLYDATMHEIVEADFPSHSWVVLEHGYGFEGWITVPRAEHLVFLHGRLGAPVFDPISGGAAAPFDTVGVQGGFNRVSFILGVGNVLPPGEGGAYSEKATSPDGTTFELTSIPGGPFEIQFFEHPNPDGDWQIEHTVAGGGFVFIEGIAYHQYDIHVPTRNIRSDHSHEVVR